MDQQGALALGTRTTTCWQEIAAGLQLDHNITGLQFTSNGLVLGGGTVRLAIDGLISLPLGITRRGLWNNGCLPAENANS